MGISEIITDPKQWLADQNFPGCGQCGIASERRFRSLVMPRGALDAPIVIVGEAPGQGEEIEGEAFIGSAGKLLDAVFQNVGIDTRELMYITNTVKCRPLNNRTPVSAECRTCRELFLKQELNAYPRKLIIALGNIGYYGVVPKGSPSGIMSRSGIFEKNEEFSCLVLPCIHTAAVLRNPSHTILLEDVAAKVRKFIDDGYNLPDQHSTIYKEVRDLDSFETLLQELRSHGRFVVDLETTGFNFWGDRILCMTFSTGIYTAWYLPLEENEQWLWPKEDWTLIQEGLRVIFEDPNIGKIGHNLKFDLKFLIYHFGWDVSGKLDDTMLMHHLIDENTAHGLKSLAARFTDLGNYSKELEDVFNDIKRSRIPLEDKHYGKIPTEVLKRYALLDADVTYRLYEIFKERLKLVGKGQTLFKFYSKIIMWVMRTLMHMELVGVRVNIEQMTKLQEEFGNRLGELQDQINTYAEGDINIRSTKQLRELLYVHLGLEVIKDPQLRTPKGGPSTDEATLKALQARNKHPILGMLLEYRRISKLNSTYVIGLLRELAPDSRLHTSYMQHGTATGRLSSSRPNLQNIPRESIIKSLFVPTEGWYFVRGDYSQHELRMWANYSKDSKFIAALAAQDVHSYIGSILLNKDPATISKEERTKVKGVVFGLIYGRGTKSLAAEFDMTPEEAQKFTDAFFEMFPESSAWLKQQEKVVTQVGQVTNTFGRVRRLPEVHSTDNAVSAMAIRQARNSPIQSLASDVTNFALVRISETFKRRGLKARLLMQIHDEIVAEAPRDEVLSAYNIMYEEMMKQPRGIVVPLKVDLGVVDRWGGTYLDLAQFE